MERKNIVIRTLAASVGAAALTPTAEAALQMWQGATPIVEAQATINKNTSPLSFPFIDNCITPSVTVPLSGTLTVREVAAATGSRTIATAWFKLNGFNPQGAEYTVQGESATVLYLANGFAVSTAPSIINAERRLRNTVASFNFVMTNGQTRVELGEFRCVG